MAAMWISRRDKARIVSMTVVFTFLFASFFFGEGEPVVGALIVLLGTGVVGSVVYFSVRRRRLARTIR